MKESKRGFMKNDISYGKALTWDELADMYPGTARIKSMDKVFEYFEKQKDKFYVDEKEGTIHLLNPASLKQADPA